MNMENCVITVIDNNSLEMLQYIYEKGKLVERSGRKTTNLSLPCRGGYGSRVAMEKKRIRHADSPGQKHSTRRLS